jgi:shikimate dehydrogenase
VTDRYAVFGNPIAHSKSPQIHRLFAEQLGEDIVYEAQLVEPGKFEPEAHAFFASGGKGLNVTLPFKTDAYGFAHRKTERARRAGAVNTLTLSDNIVQGDNTDGFGLLADLQDHLGWSVEGKNILILGAGGAVRGVLGPLLDHHPRQISLANRTHKNAQELARAFSPFGAVQALELDALADVSFDLVINGTSASLAGERITLPETLFSSGACSYDMMYGAEPTAFLQWSAPRVKASADGLGMLVAQAAEAFRIWRGVMPDFVPVIERLRQDMLNK